VQEDVFNTTTASGVNGTDNEQALNQTSEKDDDVNDDDASDLATDVQPLNQSFPSPKFMREDRPLENHHTSSDASAAAEFQHTKFGMAVTHHVSAFLTWPRSPDVACSRAGDRDVVGYQLRYRRAGDSDYVSRYLVDNMIVLDDLVPNTRYRYQLQYVTETPGESLWSQEAELDTAP